MISYSALFVVGGSEGDVIESDGCTENQFDFVVSAVTESEEYYPVRTNREKRLVWALLTDPEETGAYYNIHTARQFMDLSHVIEYLVLFELSELHYKADAEIYVGGGLQGLSQLDYFKEVEGERGEDCATWVCEKIGVDIEWDWNDFAEFYPLTQEI